MQEILFEPSLPYNAAFFDLYESVYILMKEKYGEGEAINFMRLLFAAKLKVAYESMGFTKGKVEDFVRCVGERDKSVGLKVSFVFSSDKITYRFHTDPFPGLKGKVDPIKFDATYIEFKISYLLGDGWTYKNTKHILNGDEFTEYVITKNILGSVV